MSELRLNTDGHIIKFGADNDVSLTHVADTGLLLNSTMQLQFNDASQNINAPSATVLDINATDEIELNATLVDINANVEISGTATTTGVHTFTAVPVFPNNTVETADIQADAITGAKIADDAINSEHYTDGSIDTAHIADGQITLAKTTGLAGSVVGQWRITSSFTGDAFPIAANWEEVDTSYSRLGSAMTQSSGVFTFPSTGIYMILYQTTGELNGSESEPHSIIDFSVNSGSNFAGLARSSPGGTDDYVGAFVCGIFDVTNVSTHKVQFVQDFTNSSSGLTGDTNITYTGVTFIKLGDT